VKWLEDVLETPQRAPAECVVEVGGMDLALHGLYPLLREVRVETSRSEAATATLIFDNRRDVRGRWDVQDEDLFAPWQPVDIAVVFGAGRRETVFRGYVREAQGEYPEDGGAATFTVTCQDTSLRLDREHRRVQWAQEARITTEGQVLRSILGRYGLAPIGVGGVDDRQVDNLSQDDTDIKFLRKRAEANGYELIFYPDGVYFGPMRLTAEPQAPLRVYAGNGTNCLSLQIREDAQQPDRIRVQIPAERGDASRDEELTADLPVLGRRSADSEGRGLEPFVWTLGQGAGNDRERLRAQAQTKINEADIRRVVAEGELDGSLYGHVLRVGLPVTVDGVGTRQGGIYYVDRVSHRIDASGYRQSFTLLRNAVGERFP